MTLLYKYNEEIFKLEDLIESNSKIKRIWGYAIKDEYEFWSEIRLFDLIIETTENFENRLAEEGIDIEFFKSTDEKFDLNVLLQPLMEV